MTDYTKQTIQLYYISTISVSFSDFKESMGDCFTDEDAKKVWAKMIQNYNKHIKTDKFGYDIDESGSAEMEFYECEDKLQEIRDDAVDELGVKEKDM